MAKTPFSARVPSAARTTASAKRDGDHHANGSSRKDGDGNHVLNEILLALSRAESDAVLPNIEFMRLKLHHVLHEGGETLKSAYFCNSGMFSVLNVMPDGKSVEVGLIGKEGFSGTPLVAGFRTAHTRTVVQADATAFRVDADVLRILLPKCPKLERALNRFAQFMGLQAATWVTCTPMNCANRLHEVNERLARWLLMTQDRVGSEHLPLTQEFLAQMLGTRRSSVTVSAGTLKKAGLISYTRGHVAILDRHNLEEAACDCYGLLQKQVKEWESQDA